MYTVALKSLFGLFSLWVFTFCFWKDYRMDAFRESVFALRDRLFLFAAQGGISFSDPAYMLLRERMNLLLRYAHELTLARVLLAANYSEQGKVEIEKWNQALAPLPQNTRNRIEEFNALFVVAVMEYIVWRSYSLSVALLPIRAFVQLRAHMKRVFGSPQAQQAVARLEYEAEIEESEQQRERPLVGARA